MHAGRVRLRPILMTTFALIAGMMPVAIGIGEGGEFYSPDGGGHHRRHHHLDAADAAGGAELLRQHRDRARARWHKFRARAAYRNPFVAFLITAGEVCATLYFFRFFYRVVRSILGLNTPAEHPVERAARLVGFRCRPVSSRAPSAGSTPGSGAMKSSASPPPVPPDPEGTP